MKKRIIIIPNSEVTKKGDTYNVLKSQKEFYKNFEDYDYNVSIAAIIRESEKEFFGWNLAESHHVDCIRQNLFNSHNSTLKKPINYFFIFFIALFNVLRYKKFYVFLPGNISAIYLIFLLLFKKEFGLYVRGDFTQYREYFLYKIALKKAKYVITTGNFVREKAQEFSNVVEPVVPMMNTSKKDLYYQKSTVITGIPSLLFIGRLSHEKGINDLIDAAELLQKNEIKFHLNLVGGGEKEWFDSVKEKIIKKKLEHCVFILGAVSNKRKLNDLLKSSDIFVFPSHHEGFPRVVYEAMTFGLPMVLTNINAYYNTFKNYDDCSMVNIQSPKELADEISKLISDENIREKYSKSVLKKMSSYYREFNENKNHTFQVVKNLSQ